MAAMISNARRLRQRLASGRMLVAPGAYDGMTARMVQAAGFEAVYMTGAGVSARIGLPDYGLATMTEMADAAQQIVDSVDIPLIADADTAYGNELNAIRTVQAYCRRGVAGFHVEDQVFPKKCGHLDGKEVIPLAAYARKIRAIVDQRPDPDFLVIARTDARTVLGFDAAVDRCNAALEAGADMAFLESPLSVEEVAAAPKRVRGPCLLNMVHGGKTPLVSFAQAEEMGYALTIVPALTFMTVMQSVSGVLARLKADGAYPVPARTITVQEAFATVGADGWDAHRGAYGETQQAGAAE